MILKFKSPLAKVAVAVTLLAAGFSAQAVTAGPGTWSAQQTWSQGLTGFYFFPSTQPTGPNGKRALVLVLHGCTQTASADVVDPDGFNFKAMGQQYGAVILAPNATGNYYSNHCWDYTSSGHDSMLLALIDTFKNNATYSIDPAQVYVTGLSSGGGMTMRLGCKAPHVFAGVGINAGPPPGTTTAQIGYVPSGYTASTAATNCRNLAGGNTASFNTQIAGAVWGTADYTVAQAYGPMDTAAMRQVYGGTYTKQSSVSVPTGGTNIPYKDSSGRVRTHEITVSGMAHAWPAGSGGQNSHYVDSTKINYPSFVMNFWFTNNIRAGGSGTTTTTAGGTTTTAGGTTTTTTATTTTTTVSHAYDQTAVATVTNHYIAARINVTQYNILGVRYGYNTSITLYHCPSLNGWTDHSNCSAI